MATVIKGTQKMDPNHSRILNNKFKTFNRNANSGHIDLNKIMASAYDYFDTFYRLEIANDVVCKKGCNYCCKVPVNLSAFEAQYIENQTGLTNRLRGTRQPLESHVDHEMCLFNKNGLCSIYEYRPLNCRIFGSFDSVEFCKKGNVSHQIATVEIHDTLLDIANLLGDYSFQAQDQLDMPCFGDIRGYFGTLKNPKPVMPERFK